MTRLEKQLSSAIERMHGEQQLLQKQVESLTKQVKSLAAAYNQVAQLLQDK